MRAAVLQFDVRRDDPGHNLREVSSGLGRAAGEGIELVVLPEMWPTSFPGPDLDVARALAETGAAWSEVDALSREHGLVVCGSGYGPLPPGSARPTNRLRLVEGGVERFAYDKVHLFSPTAETESFAAGEGPPPTVDTAIGRLAGLVCYDLRFPELFRVPFRDGAEVVCVSAQWPAPRATHFRALAVGLAVLDQCFVVAANRTGRDVIGRRELELEFTGNSLLVDPHGRVLAEGAGQPGLVAADLDLAQVREMRRRVPVARDARPDLYAAW